MANDPTNARELEMMRRGLGSSIPINNFDDFNQYLNNQRNMGVVSGKKISDAFAPIRRGLATALNQPLERFSDLISGVGAAADTGISYGLGGASSALGMDNVGQYFLDSGENSSNRMKEKFSEMVDPNAPMGMYDSSDLSSGFRPGSDEALLAEFGADPSISGPMPSGVKPGDENKPSKPFPREFDDAVEKFLNKPKSGLLDDPTTKLSQTTTGPSPEEVAMMEAARSEGQGAPAENAFMEALAETNKAKGQEQPKAESRADLLEKYKQEFAEATGIEIDGSPDNSQALMAMGLSLMQNRAGKGFNIGKILNAAGEAGEKAMPYIAKASSEAKAASLAAGKYALGRIQEGESAASAFAAETRKHKNAWDLELMKQTASIEQEQIKSGGNLKLENVKPFPIGAGDITVQTGTYQDEEYGKRPVFVNGDASATEITNAYKKYTDGQDNIVLMQESLAALEAQDSTALAKLADRAKSIGVAWGVVDGRDMFGEKGLSSEAEFGIYRQATINAFKKLILQESQVSNLDLTTLFNSFGNADKFMQNPAEARLAINTMMSYFASKKETLQGPLDKFTDRSYFQTDIDFERAQKTLEGIGILQPNAKATSSGSGRYNIDISGAMPLTDEKGNFTNKNISLNDSGQISYTSPQQAG
mgnify:CR=1 FL=1